MHLNNEVVEQEGAAISNKTLSVIVYLFATQILHSCEAVNRCGLKVKGTVCFNSGTRSLFSVRFNKRRRRRRSNSSASKSREQYAAKQNMQYNAQKGCLKSRGSRGCVVAWTCQTLIAREKDHRHSKLKITDTVLIELKLFRLYALNRAELTVRNTKCHMRNQFTLSSVWGY